jgi:hypothetical protein
MSADGEPRVRRAKIRALYVGRRVRRLFARKDRNVIVAACILELRDFEVALRAAKALCVELSVVVPRGYREPDFAKARPNLYPSTFEPSALFWAESKKISLLDVVEQHL